MLCTKPRPEKKRDPTQTLRRPAPRARPGEPRLPSETDRPRVARARGADKGGRGGGPKGGGAGGKIDSVIADFSVSKLRLPNGEIAMTRKKTEGLRHMVPRFQVIIPSFFELFPPPTASLASGHVHAAPQRCCSWPRCGRPRATSRRRIKFGLPLRWHVPPASAAGAGGCKNSPAFSSPCR